MLKSTSQKKDYWKTWRSDVATKHSDLANHHCRSQQQHYYINSKTAAAVAYFDATEQTASYRPRPQDVHKITNPHNATTYYCCTYLWYRVLIRRVAIMCTKYTTPVKNLFFLARLEFVYEVQYM